MSTNISEPTPYPSDRTSLEAFQDPRAVITSDNKVVFCGDRVYNYYDLEWGLIVTDPREDGWFEFEPDRCSDPYRQPHTRWLDGTRVSSKPPAYHLP